MPRWQPFDVVGGAYSDDTRPWTVQDTVNYLVVNAERPGGRSAKMLRDAPGMVTFCASMPESSVRGLYVAEGRLFAVVGTTLYSIATDGSATSLGTIPGVGRCVFTHNQVSGGNQVVIGNGQSGYVFNTTDDTLTQITDEGFPGFRSVDFADQYIIGVEPFGRYWFHSDLADAASYSTLDRAEAEKAPDRIMQAIATGSDVLVLGERTGQFFYNTGEATGTWSNRSGAEMDVGAASPWTACRLDNTVYWLGNDGSVYRLNGYVPQRISTHALEQAISRCTLSDAYAFTFEDRGHKCYILTFPDGRTWCFDAATQEWTRRESYGFDRWRVSALVKWGRNWIAGDFINGRLYQLDWNVKQEAGEPLERRRVTGVLHDDQNRLIVNALELKFDTGMDEVVPVTPEPTPEPAGTRIATLTNFAPRDPWLLIGGGNAFTAQSVSGQDVSGWQDGWKIAFSPDGQHLAMPGYIASPFTSENFGITVYKYAGGAYSVAQKIALDGAYSVAYSPGGLHLFVGCNNTSLPSRKVYKRAGDTYSEIYTETPTLPVNDQVWDAVYSPDGAHLIVSTNGSAYDSDRSLTLYTVSGDTYTRSLSAVGGGEDMSRVYHLAYSDDLLIATSDGHTRVYKRTGGSYALTQDIGVGSVFTEAAVNGAGTTMTLFTGVYTRTGDTFSLTGAVSGVTGTWNGAAFAEDGRLFISTTNGVFVCESSGSDYVAVSATGLPTGDVLQVATA